METWIDGTQYHLECTKCKLNIPHTMKDHVQSITGTRIRDMAHDIVIKKLHHKTTFNNPTYVEICQESWDSVESEVVAEVENRTK